MSSARREAIAALHALHEGWTGFGRTARPGRKWDLRDGDGERLSVLLGKQEHIGFGDGALDELRGVAQVDIYASLTGNRPAAAYTRAINRAVFIHDQLYAPDHRGGAFAAGPYTIEFNESPDITQSTDPAFPAHMRVIVSAPFIVEVPPTKT